MRGTREAFFDALRHDFNTPAALAAMDEWIREANRRGEGVGDADLREMLAVLGLDGARRALGGRRREAATPQALALAGRARAGARASATSQRADRVRERAARARLGGARRARGPGADRAA